MAKESSATFAAKIDPNLEERLQAKLANTGITVDQWLATQVENFLATGTQESEPYLRAVVDATPECIKVIDTDGTIVQINAAGLIMVESESIPEVCGTSVYRFIAPEFHEAFRQYHEKICRGEKAVLEFDMIGKNGACRHTEAQGVPFAGPDGKLRNLSLIRDVTSRKEAEEVQRRTTETLAELIKQSPLGIYVVDSDFRVSLVSRGALPAFRNVHPLIGRDFEEIMHTLWPESFASEAVSIFRHTLKTGEPYVSPGLTEKRKDISSIESYEWQVIRVTLADGRYGAVCYYFDVTRLQAAKLALQESEERFRMLAENMNQLAWTCEQLGEVNWYNQRWHDYTGMSFAELKEWGWKKLHHPDHIDRVEERICQCRERGEIWEDTFPLRGKDGKYRWFLSRAQPIRDEQGHIVRWFGTNTDVTELRETQQLLRDADRRKDEFLATLAHELRNPLAPIRTGLEVMKMAKDNPETLEKVRNTMERQTGQLISLVDDLLNVSRITRGKLELRKSRILLAEIIESAVEATRSCIDEKEHELSIVMPGEAIHLNADPNRMVQIVSNLLNNAAKYTPNGGDITLKAERHDGEVLISVEDNGIGIPPPMLDQIFEMFAQIDRPQEKGYSGLGIGLALVKSLVEKHDGTIEVHSDGSNRGSVFRVRLPVHPEEKSVEATDPNLDRIAVSAKKRKVLVVDDNEEAATMLAIEVELLGNEVRIASDGKEAIHIAAEQQPDVILMDLGMPNMNGFEAARHIRNQPWGKAVRLVALTGWGQEDDRRKTEEAGFDYHLVKPADSAALRSLLNK
ncbi:MAG: PAS domain S-box protein [Verrucomicrobiales bacterium]|nr:PAS domain S-box protein [Verrucomicrobiales bacterium]